MSIIRINIVNHTDIYQGSLDHLIMSLFNYMMDSVLKSIICFPIYILGELGGYIKST